MVELAWLWQRYQLDSALSYWFRERVGSECGRIRRITIVALARELLVALWRYKTLGELPNGVALKTALPEWATDYPESERPDQPRWIRMGGPFALMAATCRD